VVALHTRGVADVPDRVEAIRSAAAAWAAFWAGHLDLDALSFDVTEHLTEMADAKARTQRATGQAQRYWRQLYGDDELLLSVPGMGPVTASVIRGFLADGTVFASGKAAASYVGLNPSTWSSGTVSQPSRAITKEGPAVLRLAFFQARERGPAAGSAAGQVLPPADDRTWSLPHPGLRGGRPQTGRTDLDSAQPRHPLPDP
jgi:transposase